MAVWCLRPQSGELQVSAHFYDLLPELVVPLARIDDLLSLMPAADSYIFQKTFGINTLTQSSHHPAQMHSCEVRLAALVSSPRLRFIGRITGDAHSEAGLCFQGVVVSSNHWLANPGPETIQQWLGNLFAESPVPSIMTDSTGIVLQQNQALEKLLNLTPRQAIRAIGHYNLFKDKNISADTHALTQIKRAYEQGHSVSFDLSYPLGHLHRNKLLDKPKLYLRAHFLPLKDRNGKVARMLVQIQDCSLEFGASEALQQQDQLLYSLINNSRSLITVKSVTGHYLLVNQSFSSWLGRDLEEICGKTDAELFDPATAARLAWQDQQILQGHDVAQAEEILLAQDGAQGEKFRSTFVSARFPVKDAADNVVGVGQVLTEISRQKAIEETLENQRKELHLLLDSMHSAIWYLDRWGMIKDSNLLALKLIGDAAAGKSFIEVARFWDDPAERQREIMQVIRTGQPILKSIESTHVDGAQCWFTVDKIPTLDNGGQVSGLLLVMTDITDNLIKERALEESEARYKAFIANSSEAIWCYDMIPPVDTTAELEQQVTDIAQSARLSECNKVLVRMLGAQDINEILGSGLVDSGSQNYLFDLHHFVEKRYQLVDHDIVREDSKGRRLCYQISCVGVVENGLLRRVWGTTKDITARKRYEDRLEYQSTHDALTKLPNRIKLYREIDHWIHHREEGHLCALMLIDLDRFKEINDTLGHQVGDRLLQLIGPRLETEMSEMPGLIARLGGDEFAIFLPRIRNQRQAIVFGHRVLDALRQEFDVEGFCTEISASIGISLCPNQAKDVSTMMRYADVAMYRAKTEMSGLSLYNPEYDPHSPKRLALMGELGRAIREDQLRLYFQPKVSLESNCFYGFEALLRWNHPELGFVPPGEFIPIVEMTSLIHPMTAWVLEKSIEQCRSWHDQGLAVTVAVNLSARNLLDENMPKQIMRLLQQYQLPPKYLELEITESSIMTDPNRAMRVLDQLHELGVLLAIDDFGTGYSSLAYLKRLPVQTLKIDYSFVRNMLEDKQDEVIVNSTIHLAHNLGLKVVAEGVENEELLRRLNMMGCDDAQGYHIGRPMPADKADEWVSNSDWTKNFSRTVIPSN